MSKQNPTYSDFRQWHGVSVHDRVATMKKAAELLRERAGTRAPLMTMEQGKPLAGARGETLDAADALDWFAEEAKHIYGRVIPARQNNVQQIVHKQPIGGHIHALEFPTQPGCAQGFDRAGRGLPGDPERPGGYAGLGGGTDPLLRRCRRVC